MTSPSASLYSPGGLPAPDLDDEPNVPADVMALAVALDPTIETRWPSVVVRDQTWGASVAPLGARSFITDTGRRYIRWASAAGAKWYELVSGALLVSDIAERDGLTPKPPGMLSCLADGTTWQYDGVTWKEASSSGAWNAFVPNLTGGTGFTAGDKTRWWGRYKRVGSLVVTQFSIFLGAGFAQGTAGTFVLTAPVPMKEFPAASTSAGGLLVGHGWVFAGSSLVAAIRQLPNASSQVQFLHNGGAGGAVAGPGAPIAWAAGNELAGTFTYEAA